MKSQSREKYTAKFFGVENQPQRIHGRCDLGSALLKQAFQRHLGWDLAANTAPWNPETPDWCWVGILVWGLELGFLEAIRSRDNCCPTEASCSNLPDECVLRIPFVYLHLPKYGRSQQSLGLVPKIMLVYFPLATSEQSSRKNHGDRTRTEIKYHTSLPWN